MVFTRLRSDLLMRRRLLEKSGSEWKQTKTTLILNRAHSKKQRQNLTWRLRAKDFSRFRRQKVNDIRATAILLSEKRAYWRQKTGIRYSVKTVRFRSMTINS